MGLISGGRKKERLWGISGPGDLIPRRTLGTMAPYIDDNEAMRNSAVWASLRLRADLVSTMPIGIYRDVVLEPGNPPIQVEVPTPKAFTSPGGRNITWHEWMYSSQVELDKSGNSIGIISERDGAGLPYRIDLQASNGCSVIVKGGEIAKYRIHGTEYNPEDIWHERQYTLSGVHVGLSPVAYAAYTLGEQMSVQQFVTNWFTSGATPRARLKNTERKVSSSEATIVKEAWKASQAMGEPFVHGSDWEYNLIQAEKASADWLQSKRYGAVDVARFFGVPADLIDAAVSGESITYANISQRNLQFLIMNLGPAILRRETAISNGMLPRPRYLLMKTNSLLRMDPKTRVETDRIRIESRQAAPSEVRAENNQPPFTDDQVKEFETFWPLGPPKPPPARV